MDRQRERISAATKRWVSHAAHSATTTAGPHAVVEPRGRRWFRGWGAAESMRGPHRIATSEVSPVSESPPCPFPARKPGLITLDGAHGEGGGQILRTALTLALVTGQPFRLTRIRANRDKPGLRPQHVAAIQAAARFAEAEVSGAEVGARELTFRPRPFEPRDLTIDIGTAGATALVLETLHLPLALKAEQPVHLVVTGGTFNTRAPSFPFLETTWRAHRAAVGAPVALSMPAAGFYPRGQGRLEAWIEPAQLHAITIVERPPLTRITGVSGVARLPRDIAERMLAQAELRLAAEGFEARIDLAGWPGHVPGAAIALTAFHEQLVPATFVGLGERGKPAERVADEAVDELLAYESSPGGAIDPHSADQLLIPLALASGRSEYTVSAVTEHLRTNARTIQAFLDRPIVIEEPTNDHPGRVVIG